jgi:carbamoyl-phosphate synthase large subunit
MKSVGEVMAIGRTWQESLQKALRGMEAGLDGWSLPKGWKHMPRDQLLYKLRVPNPDRMIILKQVWRQLGRHNDTMQCVHVWMHIAHA